MTLCPQFGKCGGCLYQDLPFETYLADKERFVRQAFSGQHIDCAIESPIVIPFGTRRRAVFAFHKGVLGFNAMKSHQIVPLDACPALVPQLSDFLPALQTLARALKGSGDIAVLKTPWGIDMHILRPKTVLTLAQREYLSAFAAEQQVARLLYNHEPIVQSVQLPFPPDAFLQPSEEGEKALIDLVLTHLGKPRRVFDLFCGSGTFTKPIAAQNIPVTGFDIESESLRALGALGVRRDLFRQPLMTDELNKADVVVIDPPRAGGREQCRFLAQSAVRKIIMISCNPNTCARDIHLLISGGYRLDLVQPVEQFIYTNHIELFCVLTRPDSAPENASTPRFNTSEH